MKKDKDTGQGSIGYNGQINGHAKVEDYKEDYKEDRVRLRHRIRIRISSSFGNKATVQPRMQATV